MLFNSLEFIFLFLPLTLVGFFNLGARSQYRLALAWLLASAIFFYSWWNPANVIILIGSVFFNYIIGAILSEQINLVISKKLTLFVGILINLSVLGYFKYAIFFAETANNLLNSNIYLGKIALPLGISFFTFQQIAYLVDSYRGETQSNYSLLNYATFVTFFPHLLAGPLIHHKSIIAQFADRTLYRFKSDNLAIGLTLFSLGLFKKVVLADGVAPYANQVFTAASQPDVSLTFFEAWIGALAYTLQLYFDFSGYSDMAIGIAKMFGFQLPINFNSPYKSFNIIDFWRRWHITLSNFLRDYLYIPLGGNRKGEIRRNINLMLTMLLGGLWHGAGWSFVFWGGLHGVYLLVNHQWRSFRQRILGQDLNQSQRWSQLLSGCITFIAVVIGWVFFRARDMHTAWIMLQGMFRISHLDLEHLMPNLEIKIEQVEDVYELDPLILTLIISGLLLLVWFLPNTQQWLGEHYLTNHQPKVAITTNPKQSRWESLHWQPNHFWAVCCAVLSAIALLNLVKVSEFLYFEF
ncbi:MBOAT family O-acyltransferase [Pantanalinema sp. GBBB05]|uniref:MBOAT family O-acyltransferase n=1 Tax=Pantanalinema sp. GBBB05 TaxID=2604139 RepID=UPI001D640A4D|nr:MBOAT family protein [Pantanalinema sp. GBBB05]